MIRRLAGLLALALAAWWGWQAWRSRLGSSRDDNPANSASYPNEWGVRTRPLSRRETAAAIERERGAIPL